MDWGIIAHVGDVVFVGATLFKVSIIFEEVKIDGDVPVVFGITVASI